MAQKNIVVADQGLKLVLFPRQKEDGRTFTLNASESKALRKHVREYVAADSRDLPYDERLSANKRVGLKRNNGLFQGDKGGQILSALMAAKERGSGQAQSGEVRVYIDESKKSGNSTGTQGGTPAAAVAAGKTSERTYTKSDLTKLTKAEIIRLASAGNLVMR